MHKDPIYWSGHTAESRINTIQRLEESIARYGFIIDFKYFSDLAMSIQVETIGRKVLPLYHDLQGILTMELFEQDFPEPEAEFTILPHIAFSAGHGALKVDVPEVPG